MPFFTCAVTRAVHLEVVTDLSTENFLQASEGSAALSLYL